MNCAGLLWIKLLHMHQTHFSQHIAQVLPLFVAFVEDSATMSSIRYFENHVS